MSSRRKGVPICTSCLLFSLLFVVPTSWARRRKYGVQQEAVWMAKLTQTPHVWETWNYSFPCVQIYNSKTPNGILYVKLPKSASSTTAGVARRIAASMGSNCHVMAKHDSAMQNKYGARQKGNSFLFTIIRKPDSRALSFVTYFKLGKEPMEVTEAFVINELKEHALKRKHRQLGYIRTNFRDQHPLLEIASVLRDYDFMGVAERFDESLVVLRLLLGLDAGDILYLSSKVGGKSCAGATGQTLQQPKATPGVAKLFESRWWKDRMSRETALWRAVNASLDATITRIGRERFGAALREHRELLALAEGTCTWPCEVDTQWFKEQCYWGDNGCGYRCLDELAPKGDRDTAQASVAARVAKATALAQQAANGAVQRLAAGDALLGAFGQARQQKDAPQQSVSELK